jgi:hypothetical protein
MTEDGSSLAHILAQCRAPAERVIARSNVDMLVDDLFSMDEPWRGRFLTLVAGWATDGLWSDQQPRRTEVEAWLDADASLYRRVSLLLKMWGRPVR